MRQSRIVKVLQLAHRRGEIRTAHVVQLLKTDVHDAGRLLFKLRRAGFLIAAERVNAGHGKHLSNRLTRDGRARMRDARFSPGSGIWLRRKSNFGPLIAAFGR